jgi:hypothetical protein
MQGGDHIKIVMKFERITEPATIFVPLRMLQGLMGSFFAAGSLAYNEKLKQVGSEENLVNFIGIAPLTPTGFEVGLGRMLNTENDSVLLRLKLNGTPAVDVILDRQGAKDIAKDLLDTAAKPAMPQQKPQ